MALPTDPRTRKGIPIFAGFLAYFPDAIAAAAQLSRIGNDQHNPGQPLHWAKDKSTDEPDALLRHFTDMAKDETHRDPDGVLAAVKAFWRAGANLQRMADRGINIYAVEPPTEAAPKQTRSALRMRRREGAPRTWILDDNNGVQLGSLPSGVYLAEAKRAFQRRFPGREIQYGTE